MTQQKPNDDADARVSLLSIPVRRIRPHFWTFSVCFVASLSYIIYIKVIDAESPSWREAPLAIMGSAAMAGGFWMFFSPILVEGVSMVFAAMYRQKTREQGREEGVAEGITRGHTEADAAWREWNDRRLAAEADGQPFREPPPDFRNGSGSSAG